MTAPTRYIEDARIDSPVSVDGQTYRLVTFRLEYNRFTSIWHGMQRTHAMRLPFDVAINDSVRLNELRGRKQTERYMVGRVTAWQPDTKTATVVITTRASGRERSR